MKHTNKRTFWLKEQFTSEKGFSLEEKTFFLVTISGILMSTVGLIGNISLGLSFLSLIVPSINILIDWICLIYFRKTRKWKIPSLIVIMYAIFVLFPVLWFSTGGATGSTMPFVVLMGIFIVIAFNGKFRTVILIITIAMYMAFSLLELYYPDICIPYPSRDAHYIDLTVGMFLSYCVSVYLAYQVLGDYEKSKKKAEELVYQLEYSSITDSLTGIYNRRYLTSCLNDEMRKSFDDGSNLVLCIFDIDFFKRINDSFGHNFGDKVLIDLSNCVKDSLSDNEIFGRYGGEEFLIIFQNCKLDSAVAKLEIIYENLGRMQWDNNISLTISSGLSVYYKGVSFSNFLEIADTNLYKAKENGRNRIVF